MKTVIVGIFEDWIKSKDPFFDVAKNVKKLFNNFEELNFIFKEFQRLEDGCKEVLDIFVVDYGGLSAYGQPGMAEHYSKRHMKNYIYDYPNRLILFWTEMTWESVREEMEELKEGMPPNVIVWGSDNCVEELHNWMNSF